MVVQIHFEAGAKELGGWQQDTSRYPYCCACLPVLVFEAAQTVDAYRHRMGALKAGLGGPEGLCNLKFSCYLQL